MRKFLLKSYKVNSYTIIESIIAIAIISFLITLSIVILSTIYRYDKIILNESIKQKIYENYFNHLINFNYKPKSFMYNNVFVKVSKQKVSKNLYKIVYSYNLDNHLKKYVFNIKVK